MNRAKQVRIRRSLPGLLAFLGMRTPAFGFSAQIQGETYGAPSSLPSRSHNRSRRNRAFINDANPDVIVVEQHHPY